MIKKTFLTLFLCLLPLLLTAQEAEDIIVPEGYRVTKIAETHRALSPLGLVFDSSGDLIVASLDFRIFRVDEGGEVEVVTQSRRFGLAFRDIEILPDGNYVVLADIIYKFSPPDVFEPLIEAYDISAIAYDRYGNFYASLTDTNTSPRKVVRFDSEFKEVDDVFTHPGGLSNIVFDSGNNMYVAGPGPGIIFKISAGDDGIPGSDDDFEVFIEGLLDPQYMTIDDSDNLYVTVWSHSEIDGFSLFEKNNILKIHTATSDTTLFATDIVGIGGLAFKDECIYVGEFDRCVISKIEISTGYKTDLTSDYGITGGGSLAFDTNNNLYTPGFRDQRLFRLNSDGTFSQVGQGMGYCQTVASHGSHLYLASYDMVTENRSQVLKIDPVSETTEVIGTHYNGWRAIAFDSYGRLVLKAGRYGLDIIDLLTGTATPYVRGMDSNKPIWFDDEQNLYCKEGWGDGIKKIHLDRDYDPPRDLSGEPFFYDFTDQDYPPAIFMFCINQEQEVFIPQVETGEILKGDRYGNLELLAQGFLSPHTVAFDHYGALYVVDVGNGIFKITSSGWTIPLVISNTEKLIQGIEDSGIHDGTMNGLVKKLENAVKLFEKGIVTAAINELRAFQNQVRAQRGKKIPADLADQWTNTVDVMIASLEDL